MFGRSKTQSEPQAAAAHPTRDGAKNRPTPKRRDQEAARKQPLVVTDRKKARELDRAKRREQQAKVREAMVTGDDSYLPARDKGPVRRYIRDVVDSRWSAGEFLLPAMLLVLVLTFMRAPWALTATFFLVYGLLLVAVIDSVLLWRRIKKGAVAKFGAAAIPRGAVMYAVMRAFQMRRTRMPKPLVARGTKVS